MIKKTNEIKKDLPPKAYGEFLLVNHDKLDRVINGFLGPKGELIGGLGEDASVEQILTNYDKLAGLITDKDGNKLQHGCFWDFKKKKAKEIPEIIYRDNTLAVKTSIKINVEELGDKEKPNRKGRKAKIEEE